MTRFDTYALQTRPPSLSVQIHKYLVQEKRRETKDRAVLPRQKRGRQIDGKENYILFMSILYIR